jgi:hypothetical protein
MVVFEHALELNTPRHEIKANHRDTVSLTCLSIGPIAVLSGRLLSYRCPALSYPIRIDQD